MSRRTEPAAIDAAPAAPAEPAASRPAGEAVAGTVHPSPDEPAERASGDPAVDGSPNWVARVRELAGIIAPTTALTALLVYFGYIGTRARFAYFGVYLDLTDLSNQNLVLYGLEVLYVPAALALLAILLATGCHAGVRWLLTLPGRGGAALTAAAFAAVMGVLLIARALIGLLVIRVSRTELPGTSALALTLGPVLLAYGAWIAGSVLSRRATGAPALDRVAAWHAGGAVSRARRLAVVAVSGLVLVGLFWATNSFAWAFGQGRAVDQAIGLPKEPEVVLDTKEPLVDLPDGVVEIPLAAGPNREFRYRYRGLRLLLASGGRLFLVPAHWTDGSRTLVVPYDDQIRLQLIPSP